MCKSKRKWIKYQKKMKKVVSLPPTLPVQPRSPARARTDLSKRCDRQRWSADPLNRRKWKGTMARCFSLNIPQRRRERPRESSTDETEWTIRPCNRSATFSARLPSWWKWAKKKDKMIMAIRLKNQGALSRKNDQNQNQRKRRTRRKRWRTNRMRILT